MRAKRWRTRGREGEGWPEGATRAEASCALIRVGVIRRVDQLDMGASVASSTPGLYHPQPFRLFTISSSSPSFDLDNNPTLPKS